jgi:uncharacterized membrane protein
MKDLKHKLFEVSIFIKGIGGVIDLMGSLFLFLFGSSLGQIAGFFFKWELLEDPNDFLGNFIVSFFQNLSIKTELFVAIYLLVNGLIKLGLFIGLRKEKLWAYPLARVVLSLFIAYELYIFSHTHSLILLFLVLIDVIIIFLLKSEHKRAIRLRNSGY